VESYLPPSVAVAWRSNALASRTGLAFLARRSPLNAAHPTELHRQGGEV